MQGLNILPAPGLCWILLRTRSLVSFGPLPARIAAERVPLTLRRFRFAVNRCHALCFSVPLTEQKKHHSQGEQTIRIEGLTSCDLLTPWKMRYIEYFVRGGHGGLSRRKASREELRGIAKGWFCGVPPLLTLMGKRSTKSRKEKMPACPGE